MADAAKPGSTAMARERWRLLRQVATVLDKPMTALAFVWLALLVVDLTHGLSGRLAQVNTAIWVVFIAHFVLEFLIAPSKLTYLRRNWLTALALVLPAVRILRVARVFRALRVFRAARSGVLVRVVAAVNRGMRATRRVLRTHGVGYVAALTTLVTFAGAAGMYAFESPAARRAAGYPPSVQATGMDSYGEAVWWTAMMMTTMGSEQWPKTTEGRILAFLLALYAFAVFGYITATIASYFIGRTAGGAPPTPDVSAELAAVRVELAALRTDLGAGAGPTRNGPRAAVRRG